MGKPGIPPWHPSKGVLRVTFTSLEVTWQRSGSSEDAGKPRSVVAARRLGAATDTARRDCEIGCITYVLGVDDRAEAELLLLVEKRINSELTDGTAVEIALPVFASREMQEPRLLDGLNALCHYLKLETSR